MSRSSKKNESTQQTLPLTCWKPDCELTIYSAVENKARLMEALGKTDQLEIDLSEIIELDTAGLQLLILAKREANDQGKTISMVGHSEAVLEVLELCNLSGFFGDPVLIPAEGQSRGAAQ